MNHHQKGLRSTKRNESIKEADTNGTANVREQDVYTNVVDIPGLTGTIYTDQTGQFPITSRSGNKYVMVMVPLDNNAILVSPMNNRKDAELQRAYLKLLHRAKKAGITIKKHVLDNECSTIMNKLIRKECKLELVPPGIHHRNMAEFAIKSFKHHFIAILSGFDASFPTALWDKLLPQAELTLKLFRQSHTIPTVSAHAHLHGNFDYNIMPLLPLGCSVQLHEDADKR